MLLMSTHTMGVYGESRKIIPEFLFSSKGEHIVAALSIHPSHFCLEHISKSIEGNLMKLDTVIEGYEGNCRMQEP